MNILVVEDELKLATLVQRTLQSEGYQCEVAHDGEAGLKVVREQQPDLVILDIGLPKINGLDVCTRIRQSKTIQKDPYILMLTGKGDEVDRIIGLHTGADDYMVKPFSLKELAARVFALLRRNLRGSEQGQGMIQAQEAGKSETAIITDHFFIEPDRRQVMVQKTPGAPVKSIELTTLEFELLYTLAKKPGRVWTRTQLLDEIRGIDLWGDSSEAEEVNSASELGSRVGDDHALSDIRCLLTYRIAPPCASLSNESSEVGAATPSIIFSP